ncbi:hypothetical protein OAN34_04910 [Hyphomicrobiales bacterium]|nr:hypothetical protein [Hyphomicrobiales bacterium]
MYKKFKISFILISLLITGCSSIQTYNRPLQPLNTQMVSSIGSVIFRIEKSSDLPNVFGAADIYGGKVNSGFVQVSLIGALEDDQVLVFSIGENYIQSDETTLTRYVEPMNQNKNNQVKVYNNINFPTTVQQRQVKVDLRKVNFLAMSGYKIQFINFDGVNLTYSIGKLY